jgi:RNA polymerase sigma factor (sigma-70 family)
MAKGAGAAVLRHIHKLAGAHDSSQATDRELLQRFTGQHDERAFEVLFRRHGAMVLAAGSRVLGNAHDAEDVCQAAFLLLARKAASQRWQASVASWLYKTAHHLALKSRTAAGRRSRREGAAAPRPTSNPLAEITGQELLAVLDAEVLNLPETLRAPLVLCYLEGATRDEAAQRLGCPLATLKKRLERGRGQLQAALVKRGLGLSVVLLGTLATQQTASAAAAVLLARKTATAALALAAGRPVAGAVSSQVTQLIEGGLEIMCRSKFKAALAALVVGGLIATAGALAYSAGDDKSVGAPPGASAAPPNQKAEQPAAAPAKDSSESVTFSGRVLDPDGKPFKGAQVYAMANYGDPLERAKSGADGRFEFRLRRGEILGADKRPARTFQVVAAADGYGPAWIDAADGTPAKDLTLQLVKDQVIEGRILTQEGKPVAGATVGVLAISTHPYGQMVMGAGLPLRGRMPQQPRSVTVDDEGRFRLAGAGRGRVVQLTIEGPGIANESLQVMTTDAKLAVRVAGGGAQPYQFGNIGGPQIYGAKFEHRAQPGRTITGVVREAGTGKPLAGVGVGGGGASTQTDKDGRYELRGWAKAKEYYVVVGVGDREHFSMFTAVADTAGLGPLAAPDTELTRGIPFRGKVIDKATGKPVAGGEVWYFALWPNADGIKLTPSIRYGDFSRATPDEDGTFTLPVLPGPGAVTLRGHGDDYVAARVDPVAFFNDKLGGAARGIGDQEHLNVVGTLDYTPRPLTQPQDQFQAIALINPDPDAKELKQEMALEPAQKLKVTVLGVDGKPVAGLKIRGRKQDGEHEDWAGSDFTMIRPDPKRPRTLVVVHEATRQIGTLALKGDETGPLEIRLQPWGIVTGRLVNADGEPCPGSYVNPMASDRSLAYPPQMQVKTDKDGNFRVEGMVPGIKYQLHYAHISPEGRIEAKDLGVINDDLILKEGESRELGNVIGRPRFGK